MSGLLQILPYTALAVMFDYRSTSSSQKKVARSGHVWPGVATCGHGWPSTVLFHQSPYWLLWDSRSDQFWPVLARGGQGWPWMAGGGQSILLLTCLIALYPNGIRNVEIYTAVDIIGWFHFQYSRKKDGEGSIDNKTSTKYLNNIFVTCEHSLKMSAP